MAGFDNDTVYAGNVDFSGGNPVTGKVTTDGQLLIGSTAAPNIRVGTLTSTGGTIAFTVGAGTINAETNGATVGNTITGDSGGALSPTAGNWNILGQQAGTIPVVDTVGTAPSTERVEDRTWISSLVVDPSSTVGLRGTFTTIQAAITAATAGQTVYIRPGTYTENLTLKNGVNLVGLASLGPTQTTVSVTQIIGVHTFTSPGGTAVVVIENVRLRSNGSGIIILDSTLSQASVYLSNCTLYITNNAVAGFTGTGALYCNYCIGNDDGTGLYFAGTSGLVLTFVSCKFEGSGVNTLGSTSSVTMDNCYFGASITTSSTGGAVFHNCKLVGNYTFGGTLATQEMTNCAVTGTISIGTGVTYPITNTSISSGAGTPISGAGTISYSNLSFPGTVNTISTTTQVPKVSSNDAVKVVTPGAYPYTTVPQDAVILVDTSSARTITPLGSPTTGQMHIIKDSVGSAASNNITITPSGKNIDGAASSTMNINYGSVTIVYSGSEWLII